VSHTDYGIVVLDLDGDGYEQTGWSVFYLHLENHSRPDEGVQLTRGGQIGRPSCDGGETTGTHVHVARRYNGMWISPHVMPFALGDWEARLEPGTVRGAGRLWQIGTEIYKEPCDCRAGSNEIPNLP
jgi:hypothetical protein